MSGNSFLNMSTSYLLFTVIHYITNFQFNIFASSPKKKDTQWVQGTNIYEVFVRRYCDAGGDGIGDIQGVISKLEDMRKIGIKTMPIFDSPSEHGYNVVGYKSYQS